MSTFASASFDAAKYLSFRATYPQYFYDQLFTYHTRRGGKFGTALDLGCGPGLITNNLTDRFSKVIGVDPGKGMIATAKTSTTLPEDRIEYRVGTSEDLQGIPDGSVDLVTAGQAAHWFDFEKTWPELSRVVSKGGTVAFWGYAEMKLPRFPTLQPIISHYQQGEDALGPYWQQPGRSIVDALLDPVPFPIAPTPTPKTLALVAPYQLSDPSPCAPLTTIGPEAGWDPTSFARIKLDGSGSEIGLSKTLDWEGLEQYLRTSSALHLYLEKNAKQGEEEPPLLREFLRELRERCEELAGEKVEKVDVFWPGVIFLAGKKTA